MEPESEPSTIGTAARADGVPEPERGVRRAARAPAAGRLGWSARKAEILPRRARVRALLALLEDESPSVVAAVREELLASGRLAAAGLRSACRDGRPRVRARARALLARREQGLVLRRLLRYAAGGKIDLERALFLMSRLERPTFDRRPYVRALDALAEEVRRRAVPEDDELSRCMGLVQYLGNELGFVGSDADFDHPANVYVHRALERKQGMPLTLTAIYMLVARRVGIRAAAIPLPGHVMLRLYAGRRTLIVDPFRGGRLRTRSECTRYLEQQGLVPNPAWFRDASDTALFQRQLLNLMNSCQLRGMSGLARELHRVAAVLGRPDSRSVGARRA